MRRYLLSLVICAGACTASPSPVSVPEDQEASFYRAMQEGATKRAAEIVRNRLESDADSALWTAYLGIIRRAEGNDRAAVDALAHAELDEPDLLRERFLRHHRIRSLLAVGMYDRARLELRGLQSDHPHSPLAARDTTTAMAIESRLREGIVPGHLNWQRQAALQARQDGLPGLALEHDREWLSLADRIDTAEAEVQTVRLETASILLELGHPLPALTHLSRVDPTASDCRGALFQALATAAVGRPEEARRRARWAVAHTTDPHVREQAEILLQQLDTEEP